MQLSERSEITAKDGTPIPKGNQVAQGATLKDDGLKNVPAIDSGFRVTVITDDSHPELFD